MYYQVFRGDGSSKNYNILSEMLEDFDRQDVIDLYRLVKERFSASRPEGYDLILWGDLHTLFEPDEEDEIWKNQHEYNQECLKESSSEDRRFNPEENLEICKRIDQGVGSTSGIRACALRNFDLEVMELENSQNNALLSFPCSYSVIWIMGYYSVHHHSRNLVFTGIKMTVPSTSEKKECKKNDVKARSILLMALPNEHQLTFDQYVDAQSTFAAIKARFGKNEASKALLVIGNSGCWLLPEDLMYSSLKPTIGCDKESDNSKENTDDSLEQHQITDTETSSVRSSLKVDKDWKEKFFYLANHVREVEPKKVRENNDAPIIEDWVSDDEDDDEPNPKIEKKTVIPTATKIEFVKPETPVKSAHKHMAPRAVLMKTDLKSVNTATSVNTGRPFSTARSFNTVRPSYTAHTKSTVHCARLRTYFQNQAQSNVHRPFYKRTTLTNRCFNQRFNTSRQTVNTVRARGFNAVKPSSCWVWRPIKPNGASQLNDKGFVDSACSRHMTRNITHLSDFKDFDGGYVTFGGRAYGGRITGKGTIKTDNLDFDDVYFIKELKFNLFSVSQMCDKKNYVLFTDSELMKYMLLLFIFMTLVNILSLIVLAHSLLINLSLIISVSVTNGSWLWDNRLIFFGSTSRCIPIWTFKVDLCLITFNPELQVSHTIPDYQVSYPHVDCRVKTSLVCFGQMVELFLNIDLAKNYLLGVVSLFFEHCTSGCALDMGKAIFPAFFVTVRRYSDPIGKKRIVDLPKSNLIVTAAYGIHSILILKNDVLFYERLSQGWKAVRPSKSALQSFSFLFVAEPIWLKTISYVFIELVLPGLSPQESALNINVLIRVLIMCIEGVNNSISCVSDPDIQLKRYKSWILFGTDASDSRGFVSNLSSSFGRRLADPKALNRVYSFLLLTLVVVSVYFKHFDTDHTENSHLRSDGFTIRGLTVFVDVEFLSPKPPVSDAIGRTDVIFPFALNPQ
ncbi:hypothetical protein Tco_0558563 [Tanacetum coccineum]